ncbi:acyl-CoA carboxylase subunit epsilon [Streptomyces sp. NPDC005301]|uniref:acyl-CoA carboxylase subunit epsilon n=1 Tax=unclassified Streptomyces TaxID=2593676 RepID=UPI0033BD8E16
MSAVSAGRPSFTLVRGNADPEDLAALVGVLLAVCREPSAPPERRSVRAGWDRAPHRSSAQAGSWRSLP